MPAITPLEYYSIKIERRLRDATEDYSTRKEMFDWLQWSVSGGFGTCAALSETTDWVVKICWDNDRDGYNAYVDWCLERQGDDHPYVPEIYHTFSHKNSGLRYVFMKRYSDISEEVKDLFEDYISPIAGSRLQGSSHGTNECKIKKLNIVREGLGDYIEEIYKDLGKRYFMDVHYKNVMGDEKGKWVITDPLAGQRPAEIKPIEFTEMVWTVREDSVPRHPNLLWRITVSKVKKVATNKKVKRVNRALPFWVQKKNVFKGKNLRYT